MEQEIWKQYPSDHGIEVSNFGRVRVYPAIIKHRKGYESIIKRNKSFFIHRLVASVFIPNPEGKETVNHKNGIKTDNSVSNLEWMTIQENLNHARTVLKIRIGRGRVLSAAQAVEVFGLKNKEWTVTKIADHFNVSKATIDGILYMGYYDEIIKSHMATEQPS